jgi:hypothetical protein
VETPGLDVEQHVFRAVPARHQGRDVPQHHREQIDRGSPGVQPLPRGELVGHLERPAEVAVSICMAKPAGSTLRAHAPVISAVRSGSSSRENCRLMHWLSADENSSHAYPLVQHSRTGRQLGEVVVLPDVAPAGHIHAEAQQVTAGCSRGQPRGPGRSSSGVRPRERDGLTQPL